MLSPGLKAAALACCHSRAPHWGAGAVPASVWQCITLPTPPHIHMYLAPTTLRDTVHVLLARLREHTHASARTHKWRNAPLPIWPWSGGLMQQWQILQDPWGRREDRLRTEGNDSIWPAHMVLKESPKDRLRLDPNPQQGTKWTVLPVSTALTLWFDHLKPTSNWNHCLILC